MSIATLAKEEEHQAVINEIVIAVSKSLRQRNSLSRRSRSNGAVVVAVRTGNLEERECSPTRSFDAVVRQLNKAVKHAVRQPWLPCFLAVSLCAGTRLVSCGQAEMDMIENTVLNRRPRQPTCMRRSHARPCVHMSERLQRLKQHFLKMQAR